MSSNMHSFYLARAADAKRDAKAATLANARDRVLMSESSWRDLATRAERVDMLQAKLVADKAAQRAAVALSVG